MSSDESFTAWILSRPTLSGLIKLERSQDKNFEINALP